MEFVGGIDLGGTKIEACLFDASWTLIKTKRTATPTQSYDALLSGLTDALTWLQHTAKTKRFPIGIGAPGLINAQSGLSFTANLPATGMPLAADLTALAGQEIPIINDCRAFALSEAVLGAGQGHRCVAGLVLGTGVAGGLAIDGRLAPTRNGMGVEFGHCAIPVNIAQAHALPMRRCGCGRNWCYETLLSGPGLMALCEHITGQALPGEHLSRLISQNDRKAVHVYDIWLDIAVSMLDMIMLAHDPDCIVLGGGVSNLPNLTTNLAAKLQNIALPNTDIPRITLASTQDASGARGAALFADQELKGQI